MAFRTIYTRIGDLVVEHKIEVPDVPAAEEAPKPKRRRKAKAPVEELLANDE